MNRVSSSKQWFDVDRAGLGRQAEEQSKGRLVGELVQNALDEPGVTHIDVTLTTVPGRPLADLAVEDDSPEGFKGLGGPRLHPCLPPATSRGNPEQRGQFNFGEKLVLAVCESACVSSTRGAVIFDPERGRVERPRQKRGRGSVFQGRIKMTREEYPQVCDYLRSLLLPDSVVVTFNGARLTRPQVQSRSAGPSLETLAADDQGVMRPRQRKTQVSIYEALPGEVPSLYEMGLPVVETVDQWHVSVGQKVPLNRDRDNVRPAYLRAVRTLVLNEMHPCLTDENANDGWVRQASSDPACSPEAIKRVLDLRFGEKRAAYDPNDVEANKAWVAQGGTLVHGGMLNGQEWKNAKDAGAIQPAGHLCPTAKPYSDDRNAKQVRVIAEADWTDAMRCVAAYARFLAKELMGVSVTVTMVHTENKFLACYGGRRLDFNIYLLGHRWFEQGSNEAVDRLLIHEFGHEYSKRPPLSRGYYEALCRLGVCPEGWPWSSRRRCGSSSGKAPATTD